jgi:hypothetical protein
MNQGKTIKIIYWTTTSLFFLFDGVMPALTSNTQMAIDGIRHLGYPDYFRIMLTVFKVLGALALILPFVKGRVKEWAYAGFTISLISASVSNWAVDGFGISVLFPVVAQAILTTSYLSYHKLAGFKTQ